MITAYDVTVTCGDHLGVATVHGLPPHLIGVTDVENFADLDYELLSVPGAWLPFLSA
ncbi:MAG: hypothetical protein ACRDTG_23575 [Pseudonocardiaceae bacterium]